jgi:hypothetical protein
VRRLLDQGSWIRGTRPVIPERTKCPECNSVAISKSMVKDEIPVVLDNEVHAMVPCAYPVWECESCDLQWYDQESMDIRTDAVNAYLYKIGQGRPKEWSPKWNLRQKS